MTSHGTPELVVGSVSSVYSIRDTIESYRRSQLLSSTARVVPVGLRTDDSDEPSLADDNEENSSTRIPQAAFVHDLRWDEDEPVIPTYSSLQRPVHTPYESHRDSEVQAPTWISQSHAGVDERSPLLSRVVSEAIPAAQQPSAAWLSPNSVPPKSPAIGPPIGQSTFSQTLFNATALLLGIGMLSEPLAFSYAGWICGTLLIVLYGIITCYTAKFLAGIVISDPRVRTYADIGKKAFGVHSMPLVNFMFCFETFSVGVVLVTLYADSLNAIIPAISSDTYKLLGLVILIPTVFLPLPFLSYASLLGIMSTVLLIGVVFVDGFSKFDAPGSLWSPATTSFSFCNLEELGLAFGLFMAGFGAHAALPSLARDMAEPHRFGEAMNYAFAFATAVYALIGSAGYLMFGNDVYDEVSQNLLHVPGYNPTLNKLALWMLVVTPLTKFALSTRPLNLALESLCGLDTYTLNDDLEADKNSLMARALNLNRSLRRVLMICGRIGVVGLAVAVSILVPDFGTIMAILGSFSVFVLCVIGPIVAKISLEGKATIVDVVILTSSTLMALWGTAAAFWSTIW